MTPIKLNRLLLFLATIALVTGIGCEKENEPTESKLPFNSYNVSGYVQKGPFINGTQIIMSELNESLDQSGRNFTTQIINDRGSFELHNIDLSSTFVEFSAFGFYFDEVNGGISPAQLNLYALSDITNINTINVNIMTHLERRRVKYLISQGDDFDNAKKTAQREILTIFGFEDEEMSSSELLDISSSSNDNAVLLAISVILQGERSVGELSELLANISNDIQEDGVLSDESIYKELKANAERLNPEKIRENLQDRYNALKVPANIPHFEKFISQFLKFVTPVITGEIGVVTDIDGNTYKTIGIGRQMWMAENLKTTMYNDGTPIMTELSDIDWINTKSGSFSVYPHNDTQINEEGINSSEEMVNTYGRLYNWHAVVDEKGLCPVGWKIPSNHNWDDLITYLMDEYGYANGWGDLDGVANKLKSCRQVDSPLGGECATNEHPRFNRQESIYGTNDFGFNALPAGIKLANSIETTSYDGIGMACTFWTISEYSSRRSYVIGMGAVHGYTSATGTLDKISGASVRCIRD